MGIFTDRVWVEYPIPFSVSIWGESQIDTETSLEKLIVLCVADLASNMDVTESMRGTGTTIYMPEGARDIISVTLDHPFQGNKFVKWTFDSMNHVLYTRFTPTHIKYRRALTVKDLETLTGNRLKYATAYVLKKMAVKEHTILTSVHLEADNGEVNLEALSKFADECKETIEKLTDEIIFYVPNR